MDGVNGGVDDGATAWMRQRVWQRVRSGVKLREIWGGAGEWAGDGGWMWWWTIWKDDGRIWIGGVSIVDSMWLVR